ncbi:MAG: SEC-C domain-containing protein [Candidatus Zixiibacteriota bacterium]|nr:MAG: SEC-C domain-containing protein [candidate division Zixibacteria bacterium]
MHLTAHQEKDDKYYDAIYKRGYNTAPYYPLYEEVLGATEKLGSRGILEIGCGVGDLGKLIIDRGIGYRGFDFSKEAIRCSKRICPDGDFRVADAYDRASYRPYDYDTVVALEVLEHVDDLRIIRNIPAGVRLIASVPNYDDKAHLRLYRDYQRDIIKRFRRLLDVTEVKSISRGPGADANVIYLFQAVRLGKKNPNIAVPTGIVAGKSVQTLRKVGRNDPCPCGSGKKYKKCCLPS